MPHRIDRLLRDAGLPPLQRSAWVEVDTDRLRVNSSLLSELAGPAAVGAVVKADGYGHGLEMAARCAVGGGATWLCVADAGEAARLRDDGYGGRVLVLYPIPPAMVTLLAALDVDVTVGSVPEALAMGAHLEPGSPALRVHLEIDTGMTRGGVLPDDALLAATALAGDLGVVHAGTWTHLAAPEDPEVTAVQITRFDEVLSALTSAGIDPGTTHTSASGGLLTLGAGSQGLVRPGLAFYGCDPGTGAALPPGVLPALAVKAHPVRLTRIPAGTSVGYGGTWTATTDATIATLPLGYADGWSRTSSPGGEVLVAGRRALLVGRVSSDSMTVDVTGIEGVDGHSEFTLLGEDGGAQISADEVASVRGTISWEVLQQLGARLARVYWSGNDPVALRPEATVSLIGASARELPGYGRLSV
ncbi:MAG TPA: alanine racemase [Acidimicrobiia bacterium]